MECFSNHTKVVCCKYRENSYITIERAYIDTIEREREIKSMMVFNEDVDKWHVIWEHEYNEKEKEFKDYLGCEESYDLVDKLNPRDSVKGGRTEVFRMHVMVKDSNVESISYLDVNSFYPFMMSMIEFPVGHPIIRRGDESCRDLLRGLERKGEKFIGLCQIRVLAPGNLMIPSLAHKIDGKLMFFLCRACSSDRHVQRKSSEHSDMERSWIDIYTSIDVTRALVLGYTIMEYKEVWYYPKRGKWLFRDFILNIVQRKIECSGFLVHCSTDELHSSYVKELEDKCGIKTSVDRIKNDPAGHYLNKIMANSVWGNGLKILPLNKS